ncbi:DUF2334 domain-containing protein [Paraconexibacter sp. AEG42_29]
MPSGMSLDEIRTAGLLFGEELALGLVEPSALRTPEVLRTVRTGMIPSLPSRLFQARQLRRGRLSGHEHSTGPRMAARRAILGDAALGRPKLLIRVDGFPHMNAWDAPAAVSTTRAAEFHAVLRDAGVPYLMSVLPRVPRRPLEPQTDEYRVHASDERELLAELRRDGVSFGAHGLDHRSRSTKASRRSEFPGGKPKEIAARLDEAIAALRDEALHTDVFVPPFDRFGAICWRVLAERFDVVCGGPASVATMGFHPTPSWRGDAVWMPAYAPLHGTAAEVLPAVRELVAQQTSLWIPVVLQWDREVDDLRALRELCDVLAAGELARSWDDFLLAVNASRQLASSIAAA